MTRFPRALAVAAASVSLLLASCSGDDAGAGKKPDPTSSASLSPDPAPERTGLPLPATPPDAVGPARGPALVPRVLLAGVDGMEEAVSNGGWDRLDRETGVFVTGTTAIGFSIDNVSGYDLQTGDQLWTQHVGSAGGICMMSDPQGTVSEFTVVSRADNGGNCSVVTVHRVSDGSTISTADLFDLHSERDDIGYAVERILSIDGRDVILDTSGYLTDVRDGALMAHMRGNTKWSSSTPLFPAPEADLLVGAARNSTKPLDCSVSAFHTRDASLAWETPMSQLFPGEKSGSGCTLSPVRGNPLWIHSEDPPFERLAQLDPATGKVIGRMTARRDRREQGQGQDFDLISAMLNADVALGLPDGDLVIPQDAGATLVRYNLAGKKVTWRADLRQWEMESAPSGYGSPDVIPQGMSPDGRQVIATVSNDVAVEVVAFDVDTGALVGRWPVPAEYRNGFQVAPFLEVYRDGVVLARNYEDWAYTFDDSSDVPLPDTERYDLGVFQFPAADAEANAPQVPSTGPIKNEAPLLATDTVPDDARPGDWRVDAFAVGDVLVTSNGATVTAQRIRDGRRTELWSKELGTDRQSVCTVRDSGPEADSFLIGISSDAYAGHQEGCDTLLRLSTADGAELDRVQAGTATGGLYRIAVWQGDEVVLASSGAFRLVDGSLQPFGELRPKTWLLTPSLADPTVLVSRTATTGAAQQRIEGYRLPGLERIWSTTASRAFGRPVAGDVWIDQWGGDGAFLSISIPRGTDTSKYRRMAVRLDPATGRTVRTVGPVAPDYTDRRLAKRLNLTLASPWDSVAVDGDLVFNQQQVVLRQDPDSGAVRWSRDLSSISNTMQGQQGSSVTTLTFQVLDDGQITVVLSNDASVQLLTLDAGDGRITGRWLVPGDVSNGLQVNPGLTALPGVAVLAHDASLWDYNFTQQGKKAPPGRLTALAVLALPSMGGGPACDPRAPGAQC